MPTQLLRCEEVAEILNVSRTKAYTLMAKNIIPAIRIGHSIRCRLEDLEAYILESKKYNEKNNTKI